MTAAIPDDIRAAAVAAWQVLPVSHIELMRDPIVEVIARAIQAERNRATEAYAALARIAALDPDNDSEEGWNEWGEADCFNQAQEIASAALRAIRNPTGE